MRVSLTVLASVYVYSVHCGWRHCEWKHSCCVFRRRMTHSHVHVSVAQQTGGSSMESESQRTYQRFWRVAGECDRVFVVSHRHSQCIVWDILLCGQFLVPCASNKNTLCYVYMYSLPNDTQQWNIAPTISRLLLFGFRTGYRTVYRIGTILNILSSFSDGNIFLQFSIQWYTAVWKPKTVESQQCRENDCTAIAITQPFYVFGKSGVSPAPLRPGDKLRCMGTYYPEKIKNRWPHHVRSSSYFRRERGPFQNKILYTWDTCTHTLTNHRCFPGRVFVRYSFRCRYYTVSFFCFRMCNCGFSISSELPTDEDRRFCRFLLILQYVQPLCRGAHTFCGAPSAICAPPIRCSFTRLCQKLHAMDSSLSLVFLFFCFVFLWPWPGRLRYGTIAGWLRGSLVSTSCFYPPLTDFHGPLFVGLWLDSVSRQVIQSVGRSVVQSFSRSVGRFSLCDSLSRFDFVRRFSAIFSVRVFGGDRLRTCFSSCLKLSQLCVVIVLFCHKQEVTCLLLFCRSVPCSVPLQGTCGCVTTPGGLHLSRPGAERHGARRKWPCDCWLLRCCYTGFEKSQSVYSRWLFGDAHMYTLCTWTVFCGPTVAKYSYILVIVVYSYFWDCSTVYKCSVLRCMSTVYRTCSSRAIGINWPTPTILQSLHQMLSFRASARFCFLFSIYIVHTYMYKVKSGTCTVYCIYLKKTVISQYYTIYFVILYIWYASRYSFFHNLE